MNDFSFPNIDNHDFIQQWLLGGKDKDVVSSFLFHASLTGCLHCYFSNEIGELGQMKTIAIRLALMPFIKA